MAQVSIRITARVPPGRGFSAHALAMQARLETAVIQSTLSVQASSMRAVPVLTGGLRGSCRTRYSHTQAVKSGWVTYSKDYALKIHEDLSLHHPQHHKHNCGGDAKYLERPMRILERDIIERIRRAASL